MSAQIDHPEMSYGEWYRYVFDTCRKLIFAHQHAIADETSSPEVYKIKYTTPEKVDVEYYTFTDETQCFNRQMFETEEDAEEACFRYNAGLMITAWS